MKVKTTTSNTGATNILTAKDNDPNDGGELLATIETHSYEWKNGKEVAVPRKKENWTIAMTGRAYTVAELKEILDQVGKIKE